MSIQNPWKQLPHYIYEKHMGHENVRQLEMLSRILKEQLAIVADMPMPTVAILGITGGNGLENIETGLYKTVIGMDINEDYLKICHEGHGFRLPELTLYQIDLMTEKDRAVGILKQCDLLAANLLVKHIHLENFIDIVRRLEKPIISVTIQINPDGHLLSESGFESAFEDIQTHGENCDEPTLDTAMREAGYVPINRTEYELPNKMVFIRLDYKRQSVTIRPAVSADAEGILRIYSPYITDTSISFETEVPSIGEFSERIKTITEKYTYLVCEADDKIVGYAYASRHRERAAYKYNADVSVYIEPSYHRRGIGKSLYSKLFDLLKIQSIYSVYAGITMPNDASIGLHKAFGFSEVGIYHNVGYKHGKWHDVMWLEKALKEYGNPESQTSK